MAKALRTLRRTRLGKSPLRRSICGSVAVYFVQAALIACAGADTPPNSESKDSSAIVASQAPAALDDRIRRLEALGATVLEQNRRVDRGKPSVGRAKLRG